MTTMHSKRRVISDEERQAAVRDLRMTLDSKLRVLQQSSSPNKKEQERRLIRQFKVDLEELDPPPEEPVDMVEAEPIASLSSMFADAASILAETASSVRQTSQRSLRQIVSGNKVRFQEEGYDLDLRYLTDQIIVMGLPAEGVEAVYRNPIDEVVEFFNTRHGMSHVLIFNLCDERTYDYTKFQGQVREYRMPDHEVTGLQRIRTFCREAQAWMQADKQNVIAVHCKGGKGRTGVMVGCLFLHLGMFQTADDALQHFATKRTKQGSKFVGVEGPSQKRYVSYYEKVTPIPDPIPMPELFLTELVISPIQATRVGFSIRSNGYSLLNLTDIPNSFPEQSFRVPLGGIAVRGDIRVEIRDMKVLFDAPITYFYFHTYFITDKLVLRKHELDIISKDTSHRLYPHDFCVELEIALEQTRVEEILSNTLDS